MIVANTLAFCCRWRNKSSKINTCCGWCWRPRRHTGCWIRPRGCSDWPRCCGCGPHCASIQPGPDFIKLFMSVIYDCLPWVRMSVHGKPFQPSLLFVGKARSLLYGVAPKKCFTQVGSGLTHKHRSKLERLAWHKPSSLLYITEKVYNIWPCLKSFKDIVNLYNITNV